MRDVMPDTWRYLDGVAIKLEGRNLRFSVGQYENGRLAVLATAAVGPYCKLTVNLDDDPGDANRFWVKIGGTEERMASALAAKGLIRRLDRVVGSGFVKQYAKLWEIVPPKEIPS